MTNTNESVNEAYSALKDQEYEIQNKFAARQRRFLGTSSVLLIVGMLLILAPLFFILSSGPSETTAQMVLGVKITEGIGVGISILAAVVLIVGVKKSSKPALSAKQVQYSENFYDVLSHHINKTYGIKLNRAQIVKAYKEVNGVIYQRDESSSIMRLYVVQYNNKWALLSQGSELPHLV